MPNSTDDLQPVSAVSRLSPRLYRLATLVPVRLGVIGGFLGLALSLQGWLFLQWADQREPVATIQAQHHQFLDQIQEALGQGPLTDYISPLCQNWFGMGTLAFLRVQTPEGNVICEHPGKASVAVRNRQTTGSRSTTTLVSPSASGTEKRIVVQVEWEPWVPLRQAVWSRLAIAAVISVACFGLLLVGGMVLITYQLIAPIHQLVQALRQAPTTVDGMLVALQNTERDCCTSQDIRELYDQATAMLLHLQEQAHTQLDAIKAQGMAAFASQLAHDLRSPLVGLQVAFETQALSNEERLRLGQAALQQLTRMANRLDQHWYLFEKRPIPEAVAENQTSGTVESELVFPFVEWVVAAKHAQYGALLQERSLALEYTVGYNAHGLFASVEPVLFYRVLSALVDHAITRMETGGKIHISVSQNFVKQKVVVDIRDTGIGVLASVEPTSSGDAPESSSIQWAKSVIESWGGGFAMTSQPGLETLIRLEFGILPPPPWFQLRIPVPIQGTLVILDDEPGIHAVWESRWQDYMTPDAAVTFIHCRTVDELAAQMDGLRDRRDVHYLIDYEIVGSDKNGLQVIEEWGIAHCASLVTGHYVLHALREACVRLGCQMIPKVYAPYIPFKIIPTHPHLVLVDDSPLVLQAWEMSAHAMHQHIMTCSTPEEARALLQNMPRKTPIYVDEHLGQGIRGQDLSQEIHAMGFTHVYLSTGHPAYHFEPMPWITGIVGKEYPAVVRPAENVLGEHKS